MSHILFTTLKEIDYKRKYESIISCSLFRMKNSYRDFEVYVHLFLTWFPNIPKNSYVRLYIDSTVLDQPEYQKIMKLSNLEIILFEAPDFLDKDGFHDGTFGTFVRFYPLFYKPEGIKYIWITDLDNRSFTFKPNFLRDMKRQNAKIFYSCHSCYLHPWVNVKYPIIAGRIIMKSDVNLNKGNFTRFLNNVLDGKYQDIFSQIKTESIERKKKGKNFDNVRYFPYGFDELFLNYYVYPEFMQYKRIIHFSFYISSSNLGLSEKLQKEYQNLVYQSWIRNLNSIEYKRLIYLNDEVYKKIDGSMGKEYLLICKDEYMQHKKFISKKSEDAGVYAVLIRKAGQE